MQTSSRAVARSCSALGLLWLALLCAASPLWAAPPTANERESIGLTALEAALGSAMPTGAGVTASQIEAPQGGVNSQYFVNPEVSDFTGKTITAKQQPATTSTHATNIGQNFYGNAGVAPGVDTIDVYQATEWMGVGFLRANMSSAPYIETRRIQNHSWIALFDIDTPSGLNYATDVLRRVDYVVNRDGVVVVAGVNNGSASAVPHVLGNAYNAIAVGRSDGSSSLGPSTVDVIGRSKPDLVAPGPNTSVATSWVSGAAALLLETAGSDAAAARPETIKALLMAGANKSVFDLDGSTPTISDDWSRTPTQPLDARYGAGQLDIYRSHNILTAGQQSPGDLTEVAISGWDFTAIQSGQELTYYFTVPDNHVAVDLSILATWNRQIDFQAGAGPHPATLTPSLANIDLHLYESDDFVKGPLIDQSISTIDNVEHIFQRILGPGQYALSVVTDMAAEFALAWDASLFRTGDANFDGKVDGADYVVWANNFKATGAAFWEGDFNLDGIVDGADYVLWASNFSPAAGAAAPVRAVPEPSAFALALIGVLLAARYLRRSPRDKISMG